MGVVKSDNAPVKLGITGGVGSGKSFVCEYLQEKGIRVASADDMARRAVAPGMPAYRKIVDYFGPEILSADKTLDRKQLRDIITRDPAKKQVLEQCVHPAVFAQMAAEYQAASKNHDPVYAVEVPLLYESGMEGFFDYVLMILVDQERRIARLMARDRISRAEAEALIRIQMPEAEKIEKSDFVIDNNGSHDQTKQRVDMFYNRLMRQIK